MDTGFAKAPETPPPGLGRTGRESRPAVREILFTVNGQRGMLSIGTLEECLDAASVFQDVSRWARPQGPLSATPYQGIGGNYEQSVGMDWLLCYFFQNQRNSSMWRWDQGRLAYFHFDNLKAIARLALRHNLKSLDRRIAQSETGLPFLPERYTQLWRNYSRTLKCALLVYEEGERSMPTAVANQLAAEGEITADEYFHFIACVFTDPYPGLEGWSPSAQRRYPLAFALRYGLAKLAAEGVVSFSLSEILLAYKISQFRAVEPYEDFVSLASSLSFDASMREVQRSRQARESLKVISQISYLHYDNQRVSFSLDRRDARALFDRLRPIEGVVEHDAEDELHRIASLITDEPTVDIQDLQNTLILEELFSGFEEGGKVRRTHISIERNSKLRSAYFLANSTTICDACQVDMAERFPWTPGMLDLHHLLPLASGTRVEGSGTIFSDLVPLCPTCHRGVHRYYDAWLRERGRSDFAGIAEAREVYDMAKQRIRQTSGAQLEAGSTHD